MAVKHQPGQVCHSSLELPSSIRGSCVCIGNFDGVHIGHQTIIKRAKAEAQGEGRNTIVYTFWPHPTQVFAPKSAPKMIQTQEQKIKSLQELGVAAIVFEPFTLDFSRLSAEQFFQEILVKRLDAKCIHVGYNFTFGYHRQGTVDHLRGWGKKAGMHVAIEAPIFYGETLVSSSAIRRLLSNGDVEEAATLLGRLYDYTGKVVAGDSRGRTLGFPTANLDGYNDMILSEGVYATWAQVDGVTYPSVSNVGRNPTFIGDRPVHVETHILDFNGELYGKEMSVRFVKRLRGEQSFASVDALRLQIERDIAESRQVLK